MNALTALKDLHENLILIGQPENRRDTLEHALVDAIKEGLDFFPDKCDKRSIIILCSGEVLPVQHFLNQFGFHLKRIQKPLDSVFETKTYKVVPNWK